MIHHITERNEIKGSRGFGKIRFRRDSAMVVIFLKSYCFNNNFWYITPRKEKRIQHI